MATEEAGQQTERLGKISTFDYAHFIGDVAKISMRKLF
jgi:hypothetical protein